VTSKEIHRNVFMEKAVGNSSENPYFGRFLLIIVMLLINFAKLKKVERQDKIIAKGSILTNIKKRKVGLKYAASKR
jgi:hypothetical protein